jgi:dethiobiotin synthetase
MKRMLFITGTDTGVGKTVLTVLLAQFLRERGVNVAALKPVCSGGRADARALYAAMNGVLPLDDINPWHYRAAIAPPLAARIENKAVVFAPVLTHIRSLQKHFDMVLVEGAGGLLSPLGENFNSRDLIEALRATPIIVASNKMGVVNHLLLVLEALPKNLRLEALIVLMSPPKPDIATKTNMSLLTDFFDSGKVFLLPWFGKIFDGTQVLKIPQVRRTIRVLVGF